MPSSLPTEKTLKEGAALQKDLYTQREGEEQLVLKRMLSLLL